jgi:GAF domain-containing protein
VFGLGRHSVRAFTNKQIELLTTFADQAVIAIENVRLFDEVQARTRELTQSVEELRALGEVSRAVNSTLDPETVLSNIGLNRDDGQKCGSLRHRKAREPLQRVNRAGTHLLGLIN